MNRNVKWPDSRQVLYRSCIYKTNIGIGRSTPTLADNAFHAPQRFFTIVTIIDAKFYE
ncbi:hypothetical protein JCM10914_3663 [Paenibacillus sp. JCM 10914]|nr:hypothetical protein JCM10914_3663 [Paenibacillus sp. JCM 10914]